MTTPTIEPFMFLTESELVDLTGYRQASKQVIHLKTQKIPFHTNRAGHPRVARAILEGSKSSQQAKPKVWSPSWGANQAGT